MKSLFSKIKYLFFILLFMNILGLKADNYLLENLSKQNNELLIESNKQSSDFKNSIFYAEGNVIITNTKKNIQYVKPKNINDIYKSKVQFVNFSSKMSNFDLSIQNPYKKQ